MIGAAESGGEIDGVGMRAYEDGMAEALRCEPYKLLCHRRARAGRIIRPKTPTRWGWGAPSCGRDQPFGSLERACLIRDCDGDASGAIFSMAMERCGQGRLPKRNDRASHGPKTPQAPVQTTRLRTLRHLPSRDSARIEDSIGTSCGAYRLTNPCRQRTIGVRNVEWRE